MASDDIHKSVSRLLLGHAQLEYSTLCDSWKSIEQKAQGTIAIVGVFLAVAAIIIGKLDTLNDTMRLLLLVAVVLLVAAALNAIAALFVRSFDSLEGTEDVRRNADAVLGAVDDDAEKVAIRTYVGDRIDGLVDANIALHQENARKAALVSRAQWALLAGIIVLALAYSAFILERGTLVRCHGRHSVERTS